MCLTLVAVEKYPFTPTSDTSLLELTEKEGNVTAKAGCPSHFAFPQRFPHRLPGTCGPQTRAWRVWCSCIRLPGRTTVPSRSQRSYHCGGQEGLTIFPVGQIPEDYWWPSRLETKSHYFPHSWAKTTESREFLSTALAPGTIPASVFTENKRVSA